MPYFQSGNIKLYYEERGQGRPLVFLHGFSLDRRLWDEQVGYFSRKYRVVTYDARGHGLSDAPDTGYSREDRAEDLLNLCEHLNLPSFHLVGLSMGGGDSLSFAIDHQKQLLSLTLADTVASGFQPTTTFRDMTDVLKKEGLEAFKKKTIESYLSRYKDKNQDVGRKLELMMTGFSFKPWLDPMAGNYPKRDDVRLAASVRIPTLIIVGKNDIMFLPLAEQLSQIMLDSEIEVLPGIGHMSNLEASDKFNLRLEEFLSRVERRISPGI